MTFDRTKLPQLFQPGKSGNPNGRPRSSKNKLSEEFIQAMFHDFEKHGVEVIASVREKKPEEYLKIIAKIIPKEFEVGEVLSDTITDILGRIDGETRTITVIDAKENDSIKGHGDN